MVTCRLLARERGGYRLGGWLFELGAFTYSITAGIGAGFIAYVVIKVAVRKARTGGTDYESDQPVYEEETRAYTPDPPEINYVVDEYQSGPLSQQRISWLLVGLVAVAAVVTGLLLYYFLFPPGGGGAVIGPTPTPSSSDTSWSRVRTAGRMIVGTSLDYRPFTFRNEQFQPDGFDIALIRGIADRLGVGTEIKDMAFDSLFDALNLGQIDVAIAAITVSTDREALVDFTNIYWIGEEGILARNGSSIGVIQTLSDMAGHRIGVQRGSIYEAWLQRDLVDSGLTQPVNLFVYETADAAVRDLREQRLACLAGGSPRPDRRG